MGSWPSMRPSAAIASSALLFLRMALGLVPSSASALSLPQQLQQQLPQHLQQRPPLSFFFLGSNPYRACLRKQQPVPTYTGPCTPSRPGKLICKGE